MEIFFMNFVNKRCRVTGHQSWIYEKVPSIIIQKSDGSWTFQTKTHWEGFTSLQTND